jgi:hypothetical protein
MRCDTQARILMALVMNFQVIGSGNLHPISKHSFYVVLSAGRVTDTTSV